MPRYRVIANGSLALPYPATDQWAAYFSHQREAVGVADRWLEDHQCLRAADLGKLSPMPPDLRDVRFSASEAVVVRAVLTAHLVGARGLRDKAKELAKAMDIAPRTLEVALRGARKKKGRRTGLVENGWVERGADYERELLLQAGPKLLDVLPATIRHRAGKPKP